MTLTSSTGARPMLCHALAPRGTRKLSKIRRFWIEWLDLLKTLCKDRTLEENLYQTALTFTSAELVEQKKRKHPLFQEFLSYLIECKNLDFAGFPKLPAPDRISPYDIPFLHVAWQLIRVSPYIYITKSGMIGKSVGRKPRDIVTPGDKICILFGCQEPFILRPRGDHHVLLKHAYIHDINNGNVMEAWQAGKRPDLKKKKKKLSRFNNKSCFSFW